MDNFFDPVASPNLGEDDPLRTWAAQLNDPGLMKLMATDPQAAAKRMADIGIPPPPPELHSYTDGLGPENSIPGIRRNGTVPGVYGGAIPPTPVYSDPVGTGAFDPGFPVIGPDGKMMGNFTSNQGVPNKTRAPEPIPVPVSTAKAVASPLDPIPEAVPEAVLMPQPRPVEAPARTPTDVSASKKVTDAGDALGGFGKSLQGVKPVAPPAPNYVGTPSVRSPGTIAAPNLQTLLSMVGQPGPSPLALTLGRLLATGKA